MREIFYTIFVIVMFGSAARMTAGGRRFVGMSECAAGIFVLAVIIGASGRVNTDLPSITSVEPTGISYSEELISRSEKLLSERLSRVIEEDTGENSEVHVTLRSADDIIVLENVKIKGEESKAVSDCICSYLSCGRELIYYER